MYITITNVLFKWLHNYITKLHLLINLTNRVIKHRDDEIIIFGIFDWTSSRLTCGQTPWISLPREIAVWETPALGLTMTFSAAPNLKSNVKITKLNDEKYTITYESELGAELRRSTQARRNQASRISRVLKSCV